MSEIWKNVPGYEGLYQVSSNGRVKSLDRCVMVKNGYNGQTSRSLKGVILKPVLVRGYQAVTMHKNGNGRLMKIHRLVAEAFIPNPINKPQVNHKDGDKLNNCVKNLEWCTSLENQMHAIHKGLKTGMEKAKEVIRDDGVVFPSLKDAAIGSECTIQDVCNVVKGRRKSAHGHSFKYLGEKS